MVLPVLSPALVNSRNDSAPVLEIHERRVDHVVAVIVVLVAADREIRDQRLGQAAAIGDFVGRMRSADIVALADDQPVDQP